MSIDLITISSSALPETTQVAGFRAVEAISRPYEMEVFLIVPSEGLELTDSVGAKVRLVVDRETDRLPPFYFCGVFASMEVLHELDGRALVRGVVMPKLWELGLSVHSRIFTKMSVPEIIEAVLQDNALSSDTYQLRLGNYPKEEHVCQYRESDLAFLSRWMEREGIFYFFEHTEEGEKLVLCDDKSYDEDPVGQPVHYRPQVGADMFAGDSFRSFRARHATLPAAVKLKDYNYAKPNLDVSGSASVSPVGSAEVSIYGDRFFSPGEGKRLAKLRAEELLARELTVQATGTRFHLRAGYVFEVDDHPRPAFNDRYLATEVTHTGNQAMASPHFRAVVDLHQEETYLCEVTAIPAKTQFRAVRATPWPRIYGFENGTVDGPADSEYAQIDDQGRYSVKFKFDESALKNGLASTFVRMMQPHGGGIEGFHFPLRKNTEVVFSFLGGDPDRPVISGVVPNAVTPSPVTSGNHTKNVIQTGGRNRLELEDLSGQQRVTMSTPHENSYIRMGYPNKGHQMIVQTDKNTFLNAGQNFDLSVGQIQGSGTWDVKVKNDWKSHVQTGGFSLGVVNGAPDPGAGKIGISAKSDISTTTTEGNYSLDVVLGTWTTNVKEATTLTVSNGNTKIDTQTGTTDILSKDKVSIRANNAAMDIFAKDKIFVNSTTGQIEIKADADDIVINAVATNVKIDAKANIEMNAKGEIKQEATQKWYAVSKGDYFKYNFSSSVALTLGATSETKVGVFNENLVGGKLEMAIAIKMAIQLALNIECTMGLNVKQKVGPADIYYRNASIKAVNLWFQNSVGPKVQSAIMALQRAGLHIAVA
ncbi:type VI secretion system Vgr family protein [Chondromyces apiculatus]|uniref:VgrG protein n=1 Tax=Chondromyces apiculatus DSM 436 TaxID=1192034 RepID=A0A017STW5_9BACT|nr:type VI secretion system tip protein TssI/VgrG [Chondromyces apiculatus]EYF00212.1 VgrG protein [Chondromyces apiculatus DSM 436]